MKKGFMEGLSEIATELKRLGVQGSTEIMSAAYSGNGFVPYGVGQDVHRFERERGGRDM
jgi:hypothetical protein